MIKRKSQTREVQPAVIHFSPQINVPGGISGVTLHDLFAAAALAGITGHLRGPEKIAKESVVAAHARWADAVADEMMKRRVAL